jgi:hypothetical protein
MVVGPGDLEIWVCQAFPGGIPDDILSGTNKHMISIPGDDGIHFENGVILKERIWKTILKHLPGQHDQLEHGNRGLQGGVDNFGIPDHMINKSDGGIGPSIQYHGTSDLIHTYVNQPYVFLTPDPKEAEGYAKDLHRMGQSTSVRRIPERKIIYMRRKPGKALSIDDDIIDEFMNGDGDVDAVIARKAEYAKKAGFRYLYYPHPSFYKNDGEQDVVISLYPKEDLKPVGNDKVKERFKHLPGQHAQDLHGNRNVFEIPVGARNRYGDVIREINHDDISRISQLPNDAAIVEFVSGDYFRLPSGYGNAIKTWYSENSSIGKLPDEKESYDQLAGKKGQRGYLITVDDRLVDVYGKNLQDHTGYIINSGHPKAFGLNNDDVEKIKKDYFDSVQESDMDNHWKKMHEAGVIRVREGGGETYIETDRPDTSILRRLQRLVDKGKIGLLPSILWADNDPNIDASSYTPEEFMSAKFARVDRGSLELKERVNKITLKHLPGEHDQLSHGYRGDAADEGHVPVGAKSLEYYNKRLEEIPSKLIDYGYGNPAFMAKVPDDDDPDRFILTKLDWFNRVGMKKAFDFDGTFEDYKNQIETNLKESLANSNVYMRITPEGLEEAVKDGQFENTFMSKKTGAAFKANKKSYKAYREARNEGEEISLGVDKNTDPDHRPIYGYWSTDVNSAIGEDRSVWLEQYGGVAVEFNKEKIANHLTFTDGDSLDYKDQIRSSDWRTPSILSSEGLHNYAIDSSKSGPDGEHVLFWEAQIFDRSITNIKQVVSKVPLPESLTKVLEEKGIPWSIIK